MKYHPVTDSIKSLKQQRDYLLNGELAKVYPSLNRHLKAVDKRGISSGGDMNILLDFLVLSVGNAVGTQSRFRNETERYMLFCWNELHKSLLQSTSEDISAYVNWLKNPPKKLISDSKIASRFKNKTGSNVRLVNKDWRPFVLRLPKAIRKSKSIISVSSSTPSLKINYQLSDASLQSAYTSLNALFKYLIKRKLVTHNPINEVKKEPGKVTGVNKYKAPGAFSEEVWGACVEILTDAANNNKKYEPNRFVVLTLKVLFLRISELSRRNGITPVFSDFSYDGNTQGWMLKVIGKGNKERFITVPTVYIENVLTRYRLYLGLSPLPLANENIPIVPSLRTGRALHQDSINNLVEGAFDLVVEVLTKQNKFKDAHEVASASSHWLRHTGAKQALHELGEHDLAQEIGHQSAETTARVYIAPEQRNRIKKGINRKL